MNDAPGVTGTTVTLFGDTDPLDHALSDQLGRRGCKTHYVSVPVGWLSSATHAIVRIDTAAGVDALEQLMRVRQPRSHVIAVCAEPTDAAASDRINEMCRACGLNHDISLIWHRPLGVDALGSTGASPSDAAIATHALATTVADEMAEHPAVGSPAFVTRPFVPEYRVSP